MRRRARGTGVFVAVALAACAPGEAADPFTDLEDGWNRVATGEPAACSHGSEHAFLFRPADPGRVAVLPGGRCVLDG
jgi:hypothetical protein